MLLTHPPLPWTAFSWEIPKGRTRFPNTELSLSLVLPRSRIFGAGNFTEVQRIRFGEVSTRHMTPQCVDILDNQVEKYCLFDFQNTHCTWVQLIECLTSVRETLDSFPSTTSDLA